MGLKFNCPSCGKAIIGKYLIFDDQVSCPHCQNKILVPKNTDITNEPPNIVKSESLRLD